MSVRELFSDGLNIKKVLESRRGYIRVLTESGEEVERVGGTVAWRCNNPGNLKNGRFSKSYGAIDIGKKYRTITTQYWNILAEIAYTLRYFGKFILCSGQCFTRVYVVN